MDTAMEHVHGLGVDPADGTLYVATHFGVFRVTNDGERERVADRWQDTMGFAVVGPGHFLGSGHPDLQEDLPASLGLIESTDGAETWQAVSMQGEADLHAIEPVGDRIYAYDSHTAPSSPPSTGPTGTPSPPSRSTTSPPTPQAPPPSTPPQTKASSFPQLTQPNLPKSRVRPR